ncbi:MAG: hypothetical protein COB38_04840 [Gammaproteobacteria bacterium]|nr:MAG: hypothetical protein COB38_04840 [Gammaproteobacteria bacterium]
MRFILFSIFIVLICLNGFVLASQQKKAIVTVVLNKESCGSYSAIPISYSTDTPISENTDIPMVAKRLNQQLDKVFGVNCKLSGIEIRGLISDNTLSKVQIATRVLSNRAVLGAPLWLDSRGGLVSEALKIGDLIASKEFRVLVRFNNKCFSSCVFIYAAGIYRTPGGDIGIHRPFSYELSVESISYPEYLKKYEVLTPILKNYFAKYGVSPSVVDDMNVVLSDDIRILSKEDLNSYGLGNENVAAKEFEKAKIIQVCGLDFHNLELKYKLMKEVCSQKMKNEGKVWIEYFKECTAYSEGIFPKYAQQRTTCWQKINVAKSKKYEPK